MCSVQIRILHSVKQIKAVGRDGGWMRRWKIAMTEGNRPGSSMVEHLPRMQETLVSILGRVHYFWSFA